MIDSTKLISIKINMVCYGFDQWIILFNKQEIFKILEKISSINEFTLVKDGPQTEEMCDPKTLLNEYEIFSLIIQKSNLTIHLVEQFFISLLVPCIRKHYTPLEDLIEKPKNVDIQVIF
ncbi:hypothetical protein DLEV_106 [Diachasmimorpha longicaudata entomopoxvirus]|uniref:Uncharacterized protein n=1 Tax=Diachasmimorpha longicaudata entomopoxvirus TaxID=109981 RepID=A0A7R5WUA3_9POXV|nr:hypothetical protein QKK69_gp106 [Diachasmimorpha longicaudata entomopoxvirus]AKS26397.1 hypothetical protein DLEV_106 [Diachasmimorpha longicaudata entomopoxvirus]